MALGHNFRHQLALLADELLPHLLGVATAALRRLAFHLNFHELGAETLDLLFDRRPDVIGLDHRPEPSRRRNRLQTRHARSDHKNVRRSNRPSGGHEHRKHSRRGGGCHKNRLISSHRRLRRKHIHALGPSDSRHQLQRKGQDLSLGQQLYQIRLPKWVELGEQRLAVMKQLQIGATGLWIGA